MTQASDLQVKLLPSYLATVKTIKGAVRPPPRYLMLVLLTLLLVSLLLLRGSPTWESQSYFAKATGVMGERDLLLSSLLSLTLSFSLAFLLSLSLSTFSLSPCLSTIKL